MMTCWPVNSDQQNMAGGAGVVHARQALHGTCRSSSRVKRAEREGGFLFSFSSSPMISLTHLYPQLFRGRTTILSRASLLPIEKIS